MVTVQPFQTRGGFSAYELSWCWASIEVKGSTMLWNQNWKNLKQAFDQNESNILFHGPSLGQSNATQISRQSLIISFQFIQFKVQSSNRDGSRPSHEQNQIWFLLLKFWLGRWKFYEMKALLILYLWYGCLNCDWIYHGHRQQCSNITSKAGNGTEL